ncbi:hypothetical protein [Bacillus sp. MN7755]
MRSLSIIGLVLLNAISLHTIGTLALVVELLIAILIGTCFLCYIVLSILALFAAIVGVIMVICLILMPF